MSPINRFESSLETAWAGTGSELERAQNLRRVGRAIDHYLSRIDDSAVKPTGPNAVLMQKRLERAKAYLQHLADDSRDLASMCEGSLKAATVN